MACIVPTRCFPRLDRFDAKVSKKCTKDRTYSSRECMCVCHSLCIPPSLANPSLFRLGFVWLSLLNVFFLPSLLVLSDVGFFCSVVTFRVLSLLTSITLFIYIKMRHTLYIRSECRRDCL